MFKSLRCGAVDGMSHGTMLHAHGLLMITPTLGQSPWIADTMSDVERLRLPLQHILVTSPELVGPLSVRWPNSVVVAEPVGLGGVYGAINIGAAAVADWRWITWINDDDRLLPGFGELWRRAQEESASVDVWYGDVGYIDSHGRDLSTMPACRHAGDVPALLAAGMAPFTQHGALIGCDLWNRLGGLNASLRIAGDFDFWVRAAAGGARFRYVPRKVAAFRVRSGQLSGDVAAAQAEVETVLRRRDLAVGDLRRWLAVLRFRTRNFPRVFGRVRRTGRLRSRGMFDH